MNYEENKDRNNAYTRFRSSMHIGMGILYIIFGIAVLNLHYFGAIELSAGLAYAIGILMLLYGGFRLWRGIADMRQRKKLER